MRKVILNLALSLDGFIEGPKGEYDWCLTDQDYGMTDFFRRIDAVFMGRKSWELVKDMNDPVPGMPVLKEYIFSNTLKSAKPDQTIVSGDIVKAIQEIKALPGKDIWLFGGASLNRSLMNAGLVDEYSLAVHPLLLGSGKLLFTGIEHRIPLKLKSAIPYSSGLVILTYTHE